MSLPEPNQVARFLDLCDQVELLDTIVHDADHVLDRACFDTLMSPFYPSLQQFFKDVKQESNITSIQAELNETSATFVAKFSDDTSKRFTYDKSDIGAS